jgi:hypothetical protein
MNTSESAGEVWHGNGDLRESIAQARPELRDGSGFLDAGGRSFSPYAQALPALAEILLQSGIK